MTRLFVTGLGVTTALGAGTDAFWDAMIRGVDAVGEVTVWPVNGARSRRGTLLDINEQRRVLSAPCADAPDTAVAGVVALKEALLSAGLGDAEKRRGIGIVVGTTSGGEMDAFAETPATADRAEMQAAAAHAGVGSSTDYLASRFHLGGPRATISSACTSSATAIVHAAMLIRAGLADTVIAGGCDRVRAADYAGFNALRAMSPDYCRPFDRDRPGIIMGDGAAFLVLESENSVRRRGSRPLAELTGMGMSSDAHHATAPHPDGVALALGRALKTAALAPADIGYVNCHGTGTVLNDKNEAQAMERVFATALPDLYATSTKSLTGHLLGSAGALEALICVKVLDTGWIPPMKTVRTVDPCVRFRLVRDRALKADPAHVMSNSLGFGGTNVSLVFSTVNKQGKLNHG